MLEYPLFNYCKMNRKDFFKRACLSGACMCGFNYVSAITGKDISGSDNSLQDDNKNISQDWLSVFLSDLDKDIDAEVLRKIVKKSAVIHYNSLKMDEVLKECVGDLNKFIGFIESKLGWKVEYDKTNGILIADENKNYCVCPVLEFKKEINSSAICYCSEGFAEKMFSRVTGTPVKATVISSIRKGDERCKYKIEIPV